MAKEKAYAIKSFDGSETSNRYFLAKKKAVEAFERSKKYSHEQVECENRYAEEDGGTPCNMFTDNVKEGLMAFEYIIDGIKRKVVLEEISATEPHLWAVYHCYDEDGGFGDAVPAKDMVGVAQASLLEREAFLKKWDKPEVYDKPYASLYWHGVTMEEIKVETLDTIVPYRSDDELY